MPENAHNPVPPELLDAAGHRLTHNEQQPIQIAQAHIPEHLARILSRDGQTGLEIVDARAALHQSANRNVELPTGFQNLTAAETDDNGLVLVRENRQLVVPDNRDGTTNQDTIVDRQFALVTEALAKYKQTNKHQEEQQPQRTVTERVLTRHNLSLFLEQELTRMNRIAMPGMRNLLDNLQTLQKGVHTDQPLPAEIFSGHTEQSEYVRKGEKITVDLYHPGAFETALLLITKLQKEEPTFYQPDDVSFALDSLTQVAIEQRRLQSNGQEALPAKLPPMPDATAELSQLAQRLKGKDRAEVTRKVHQLLQHTDSEIINDQSRLTEEKYELQTKPERVTSLQEQLNRYVQEDGTYARENPDLVANDSIDVETAAQQKQLAELKTLLEHANNEKNTDYLLSTSPESDEAVSILRSFVKFHSRNSERPADLLQLPGIAQELQHALDVAAQKPELRKKIYDIMEHVAVSPEQAEEFLWTMDTYQDINHPLAFQLLTSLDTNSEYVAEHSRKRSELLSQVEQLSNQECFDQARSLLRKARSLVYSGDPTAIDPGKVGMEIEYKGYGLELRGNPRGLSEMWTLGTDIYQELRRTDVSLDHKTYPASLSENHRWLQGMAKNVLALHFHLDQGIHPNPPDMGGLYGYFDPSRSWLQDNTDLNTWEMRNANIWEKEVPLHPGRVEDMVRLYIRLAAQQNTKQFDELITIPPDREIKSWQEMVFGHISTYTKDPEARLAALMVLQDHSLLRAVQPIAFINSYTAEAVHDLMQQDNAADLFPGREQKISINKITQSTPEGMELFQNLNKLPLKYLKQHGFNAVDSLETVLSGYGRELTESGLVIPENLFLERADEVHTIIQQRGGIYYQPFFDVAGRHPGTFRNSIVALTMSDDYRSRQAAADIIRGNIHEFRDSLGPILRQFSEFRSDEIAAVIRENPTDFAGSIQALFQSAYSHDREAALNFVGPNTEGFQELLTSASADQNSSVRARAFTVMQANPLEFRAALIQGTQDRDHYAASCAVEAMKNNIEEFREAIIAAAHRGISYAASTAITIMGKDTEGFKGELIDLLTNSDRTTKISVLQAMKNTPGLFRHAILDSAADKEVSNTAQDIMTAHPEVFQADYAKFNLVDETDWYGSIIKKAPKVTIDDFDEAEATSKLDFSQYESASKAAAAAVDEVAVAVQKLEEIGKLTGESRVILYGSSVTEPRAPQDESDIDLLVVYDGVNNNAHRTEWELGHSQNELVKKFGEQLSVAQIARGHIHLNTTDAALPVNRLGYTFLSTNEFTEQMERGDEQNKVNILNAVERMSYDEDNDPESAIALKVLPALIKVSEARDPSEYIDDLYLLTRNEQTNREFTDEELTQLREAYITNSDFSESKQARLLRNCIANLPAVDSNSLMNFSLSLAGDTPPAIYELPQVISDIVTELANKLPYTQSKRLRSYMQSYKLGINWLQSAVQSGGILLRGENIQDTGGNPVIRYEDKTFLNAQ